MITTRTSINGREREGSMSPIDIKTAGLPRATMDCHDMVSASVIVDVISGTGSAFVFDVIVSNDPTGTVFVNHPSTIQLTNSTKASPAFSVAGYLWFGVKLNTLESGNAQVNIYLACKDAS